MFGLPMLAGIPAAIIAYFLLGTKRELPRPTRFLMLAIAAVPVALALLISISVVGQLDTKALIFQLVIVLICGAPAGYLGWKILRTSQQP
jgi:uncharacterized membrane protein AbrB (regulator of aidB expression)